MLHRIFVFLFLIQIIGSALQAKPIFSFFNEMEGPALKQMFEDTSLIPTLQALHAEIRMGMIDLTPERAEVLRKLNEAGIPVVLWLLLPEEEGYWFHSGNGEQAIERYKEIKAWAEAAGIKFKGIGIDLELDMNDVKLAKSDPWALVRQLPGRLYDKERITEGHRIYGELLQLIEKDGHPVESYIASFVKDETAIGATAIQQLTGFLDVKVEKEIPMVYTSFMGNPYGFLKVYVLNLNLSYVALGSTGGGVDTTLPTLNWEQLAHDILVVVPTVQEIHIFSLEGCVEKGFLPKLLQFDYNQTVAEAPKQVETVKAFQKNFVRVSKLLSHPTLLFGGLTVILLLIGWGIYRFIRFVIRLLSNS